MSATRRRIEHQRDLGRDEVRSGLVHMPCHHGVGAAMSCNERNACIAGAEFASGERRCRIRERGSIGRPSCAHTHVRVRTQKWRRRKRGTSRRCVVSAWASSTGHVDIIGFNQVMPLPTNINEVMTRGD